MYLEIGCTASLTRRQNMASIPAAQSLDSPCVRYDTAAPIVLLFVVQEPGIRKEIVVCLWTTTVWIQEGSALPRPELYGNDPASSAQLADAVLNTWINDVSLDS